ncbi:MAG TPA: hypothetical protein VFU23_15175 [Gemmatimonadales bacterium]|nr:hypothetical protein [Gemmatimonadales bacterium]
MSPLFRTLMALTLGANPVLAQTAPTAPLVLRLPGGTRAAGLGNAFIAGRGAEVIFYNPAQIGAIRGTSISLARFGSAATLGTLATAGPFWKGTLGVGVQYLNYESPVSNELFSRPGLLPAGGPFQSSSLAATIAALVSIKGLRVGIAGKYVQEYIGGLRDGSVALDAGVAREVGRTTIGLSAQNIGSGIDILGTHALLPTRVSLGVASPSILLGPYFDLVAAASVSRERDGRIAPGAGAELIYQPVNGWVFVGRAGVRRVDGGSRPLESPITVGGSFGLDRFWLDYVFQPSRGSSASHRIGIRIQ